jgi:hypothetical protein
MLWSSGDDILEFFVEGVLVGDEDIGHIIYNSIVKSTIEITHNHAHTNCRVVKLSLKKIIPISRANHALAIEKITEPLPSHDQFLSAKSRKILQII